MYVMYSFLTPYSWNLSGATLSTTAKPTFHVKRTRISVRTGLSCSMAKMLLYAATTPSGLSASFNGASGLRAATMTVTTMNTIPV